MAGRLQLKQMWEESQQRVHELERINAELRVQLAKLDPEGMIAQRPALIDECTELVCLKVEALGAQGLGEDEIKAELGITETRWDEWRVLFPRFAAAAERARVEGKAYWLRITRESVARGDNRFPLATVTALISQMFASGAGKRGDASKLLVLDLAPAPRAVGPRPRNRAGSKG